MTKNENTRSTVPCVICGRFLTKAQVYGMRTRTKRGQRKSNLGALCGKRCYCEWMERNPSYTKRMAARRQKTLSLRLIIDVDIPHLDQQPGDQAKTLIEATCGLLTSMGGEQIGYQVKRMSSTIEERLIYPNSHRREIWRFPDEDPARNVLLAGLEGGEYLV